MKLITDKVKKNLLEGILPTLVLFIILFIMIFLFKKLISDNSTNLIQPKIYLYDRITDPNIIRFLFMIASFVVPFIILQFEDKLSTKNTFYLAFIAGILLWQGLGECTWHFGYYVEDYYINFAMIEGAQGTYILLLILPLLLFCFKKKIFSFGYLVFILSFLINWLGHFILIGTYPLSYGMLEEKTYFMIVGIILGIGISIYSILLLFRKENDMERRLLLSLLLFFGLSILFGGFNVF